MHADRTVLGRNCLLIQDFNKTVSLTGWNASAGATECWTVSGVVAYNHPITGQAYMLVFHQAIYYLESIENHLLCPMQCRVSRVEIYNTPNPRSSWQILQNVHVLLVKDPVAPDNTLVIPLQLEGVTSVFLIRVPSWQEYDISEFVIEMTSESPDWDPQNPDLAKSEAAMLDLRDMLVMWIVILSRVDKGLSTLCHAAICRLTQATTRSL